jgi:hypothetical protein
MYHNAGPFPGAGAGQTFLSIVTTVTGHAEGDTSFRRSAPLVLSGNNAPFFLPLFAEVPTRLVFSETGLPVSSILGNSRDRRHKKSRGLITPALATITPYAATCRTKW